MKKKSLPLNNSPSSLDTPGLRIRAARNKANFTIRELAALSGLTPETISMMENGVHSPSLKSLRKISACLNSPTYFLGCFETLPEDSFGECLKKARLFRGFTKQEAALELGVDPKTLSKWETNKGHPPDKYLDTILVFIKSIKK
ncbi:helix-turn-helix domain-containing protein [Paenibacillus lautus]|uniref:helix-turn-helix domain-containing protein n=1 Tax=Paenibacillus lautus TaxID=1401 RepID=UPI002DB5A473|nr:helix-turn-helix domain-containing protein [Paenibacillus lautus]MEC0310212.1 helix-turn-helix domain-containing protein [Paenibacillus lautus]